MLAALYPTKKAAREAIGSPPIFEETSFFGIEYGGKDGTYTVVGPSPYNRKWYAQITVKGERIVSVK